MKKRTLVLMVVSLVFCNVALADVWTITQLTDNDKIDWNPAISGTNVVWESYDENGYSQIYSNFDGQITHDSTGHQYAAISGTNVVWYADSTIYSNFAGQISSRGGAYTGFGVGGPAISGTNVVWYGSDNSAMDWGVISNFAGTISIANSADDSPSVSGTNVVWRAYDDVSFTSEIYSNFDGQISSGTIDNQNPAISGENVVWQACDGSYYDIYSNFAGQLTHTSFQEKYPAISGTNVVWQSGAGIMTNFGGQIPIPGAITGAPSISGTTVVWAGYDDTGIGDYEIYMATYGAPVPLPAGVLLGLLGFGAAGVRLRKYV